jgi:hypothetical protein
MPFSLVYKGVFVGVLPTCKTGFENNGCGTTNTYRGCKINIRGDIMYEGRIKE